MTLLDLAFLVWAVLVGVGVYVALGRLADYVEGWGRK